MKANAAGNHKGNKGKKHIAGKQDSHPHGPKHEKRHEFSKIGHKNHQSKMLEC